MAIVVGGRLVDVPGVKSISFKEDAKLTIPIPMHGHSRTTDAWPARQVVLHTAWGVPGGAGADATTPQKLVPGSGKGTEWGYRKAAEKQRVAAGKATKNDRPGRGGAHLYLDADGVLYCCQDLRNVALYHAHTCNNYSVGMEVWQLRNGTIYEDVLAAALVTVDVLTRELGIQRLVHLRADAMAGQPKMIAKWRGPGERLPRTGGATFCGVMGHRDATNQRGFGDPGDYVMRCLVEKHRYERVNAEAKTATGDYEDIALWKPRQQGIAGVVADGLPGPKTQAAWKALGHGSGLWIGDAI